MVRWLRSKVTSNNPQLTRAVLIQLLAGSPVSAVASSLSLDSKATANLERDVAALRETDLWQIAENIGVRLRSAHWHQRTLAILAKQPLSPPMVERRTSLDRDEFLERYYYRNRAVHLPAIAASWPALTRWNRDYLKAVGRDAVVEVMCGRSSAKVEERNTSDGLKRAMSWSEYVDAVFDSKGSNDFYLVSRNYGFENPHLAALLADVDRLPYVTTQAMGRSVRMWFGPSGTLTPWHHDDRNNVIIELLGRKRVKVSPPFAGEFAQQNRMWYAGPGVAQPSDSDCGLDAYAVTIELGPGDGLFIPVGWWHAVEALAPSLTLACVDFGEANSYDMSAWRGLDGI